MNVESFSSLPFAGQMQEQISSPHFDLQTLTDVQVNSDTAFKLTHLARAANEKGNYEEAFNFYQQSLEMFREIHDKDHPDIIAILTNLGIVLNKMKQYDKAKDYFEEALSMTVKFLPRNEGFVMDILLKEPLLLMVIGHFEPLLTKLEKMQKGKKGKRDAKKEYNKISYPILKKIFSALYPHEQLLWQNSLINLADEALTNENLKEFKKNYKLVIYFSNAASSINEKIEPHINLIAKAYHNLGCCYQIQKKMKKAQINLEKAAKLNPTSGIFCELGHFFYVHQNYQEAINYFLKSLTHKAENKRLSYGILDMNVCDPDLQFWITKEKPVTVSTSTLAYKLLLQVYLNAKQFEKAEEIFDQWMHEVMNNPQDTVTKYLMECAMKKMQEHSLKIRQLPSWGKDAHEAGLFTSKEERIPLIQKNEDADSSCCRCTVM